MHTARSLYDFLSAAIAAGDDAARDEVAETARQSDDLQELYPTYSALARWGEAGITLIVDIALSGTTVKSKSAALSLLCVVADQGQVPSDLFALYDLSAKINQKIDPEVSRASAQRALSDLIVRIEIDDLFIPLSSAFMHLSMPQPKRAEPLIDALTSKWFRFGPSAIAEYERLLNSGATEPLFQEFFCKYPQFIDPMAVRMWSQPDFHGAYEPDFVIRRADDTYLVVEIECPQKLLITKGGQLSAEATHAEQQVLDYETFLSERIMEARNHFPAYARADCLVVIGVEGTLTEDQRRVLQRVNGRRQNLRIVGFDWLLNRARAIIGNVRSGTVEVVLGHRVI